MRNLNMEYLQITSTESPQFQLKYFFQIVVKSCVYLITKVAQLAENAPRICSNWIILKQNPADFNFCDFQVLRWPHDHSFRYLLFTLILFIN